MAARQEVDEWVWPDALVDPEKEGGKAINIEILRHNPAQLGVFSKTPYIPLSWNWWVIQIRELLQQQVFLANVISPEGLLYILYDIARNKIEEVDSEIEQLFKVKMVAQVLNGGGVVGLNWPFECRAADWKTLISHFSRDAFSGQFTLLKFMLMSFLHQLLLAKKEHVERGGQAVVEYNLVKNKEKIVKTKFFRAYGALSSQLSERVRWVLSTTYPQLPRSMSNSFSNSQIPENYTPVESVILSGVVH